MELRGYEVGSQIGESSRCRLYLGSNAAEQVVIKVAKTFDDGDFLADEASWFGIVNSFTKQVAAMQEKLGETNAHYDWLFAELVSSFLEPTQDDRRINMFRFTDVALGDLVPLSKLRERTQIDVRTSVWILGRFLKIYSFYELMSDSGDNPIIRYANFSPGDFLIGPKRHRLIYYHHSGHVADVMATTYVRSIVQFILDWTAVEDDSSEQAYIELLQDLVKNGRTSFEETHTELYKLVKELWEFSITHSRTAKNSVHGNKLRRDNLLWATEHFRQQVIIRHALAMA